MKPSALLCVLFLSMISLAACRSGTIRTSNSASSTATAQAALSLIPQDIPIMDGAEDLFAASDGSNITYRVTATLEEAIAFYQEQTAALGWEPLGNDITIGSSITIQRSKPERNLSIIIAPISGTTALRVQITTILK